MDLLYLTSNIWEFNFRPKYWSTQNIPSKSLWKFDLNKNLYFEGETFGEGHPVLSWETANNKFYIETFFLYGLIEFEINYQGKCLEGIRTLDDGSIVQFKSQAIGSSTDTWFYELFKKYLKENLWRIFKLSSLELLYFTFKENTVILYDAHCLKQFEEDKEYEGWDGYEIKEKKYTEYIFLLEKQSIVFLNKDNYEKIGRVYMDNNLNLKGTFIFPNTKRSCFIQLSIMTEDLIKEVIESIEEK
jgi:hypothetical protein